MMNKNALVIVFVLLVSQLLSCKTSEAKLVKYVYVSVVNYINPNTRAANYWQIGDTVRTTVRVDDSSFHVSYWDDGPNGIGEFGGGDDIYKYGDTYQPEWVNFASDTTKIKLDPVFEQYLNDHISTTPSTLEDGNSNDINHSMVLSNPERDYGTFSTPSIDFYYFLKDGIELEFGTNYNEYLNQPEYSIYGTIGTYDSNGSGSILDFVGMEVVSISTTPVPEPSTMLLFGTGLLGIISTHIRRKKK